MPVLLEYPDPPLTDGRVTLRAWGEDDYPCVESASCDPHIPEGTTVPVPFSTEAGRAYIARQHRRLTNGEGLALVIADARSNRALGQINLLFRSVKGVAGVGYWLLEAERGRGLGSRAVHLLTSWAFRATDLARLEAFVEPQNAASIRTLEHAGFQREGLLRAYLAFATRRADAFIYSLLPGDLEDNR